MVDILLITEEPKIANSLLQGLNESGYSVTLATNSLEALDKIKKGKVKVVVLDKGEGWTARLISYGIAVLIPTTMPLIILSDAVDYAIADTMVTYVRQSLIVKPFLFEDLVSAIRTFLTH